MDINSLLSNNISSGSTPKSSSSGINLIQDITGKSNNSMSMGDTPLSSSCKNYCLLCKQFTNKKNQRDQGPRRHILHKHIEKPSFLCPYCDYGSKFHKHHIKKHIRDTHPGKEDTVIVRDCEEELKKWYKECFGIEGTNARPGPRTRKEKTEFEAKCASLDTPDSAYSSGLDSSVLSTPGSSFNQSLRLPTAVPAGFQASPLVTNQFCTPFLGNPFFTPLLGSSSSNSTNLSFSTATSSDSANYSFVSPVPSLSFSNSQLGNPFSPQLYLFFLETLAKLNPNLLAANVPQSSQSQPNKGDLPVINDPSKPAFFVDNLISQTP